jgi:tetratricopeptide (TPR) repeat protein
MRPLDVAMALIVAALVSIPVRATNDSLASARAMYAAAQYEEALAALDRLQQADGRPLEERRTIAQYRAYCFLALGLEADAEAAIAVVVASTPRYVPAESDVSPRVRSAFRDVRRRMLPVIIQERYEAARAAFEQKQFAAAVAGFREVIEAIGDPDAASFFSEPPRSDLRMLAAAFRDLSAAAATPAPLETRATTPRMDAPPAPSRIYGVSDVHVVPPVVRRQALPSFAVPPGTASQGLLELVIDETGRVEKATLVQGVSPVYDAALVQAARQWTYDPATAHGVPVKYHRMVQVVVKR